MTASPQGTFRLRCAYVKHGRLAYLGHLEVIHTIERVVRRAGAPYAVTQGFSPHMRIAFTSALPVGTASDEEYFDLHLTAYVPADELLARLQAASPVDLAPTRARYIDLKTPALTAQITRMRYEVALQAARGFDLRAQAVSRALDDVVRAGSIPYVRSGKAKTLDLAATLVAAGASQAGEGEVRLTLDTRCGDAGSLRPEILLAALDRRLAPEVERGGPIVSTGIQDLAAVKRYAICRTAQYVEDADGSLLSPSRADGTHAAPLSVSSVPSL